MQVYLPILKLEGLCLQTLLYHYFAKKTFYILKGSLVIVRGKKCPNGSPWWEIQIVNQRLHCSWSVRPYVEDRSKGVGEI